VKAYPSGTPWRYESVVAAERVRSDGTFVVEPLRYARGDRRIRMQLGMIGLVRNARFGSRGAGRFGNRLLSALRSEFGGHREKTGGD